MIPESLKLLTNELFDFAGLFPPAALSADDMLRTAVSLRNTLKYPIKHADLILESAHLPLITAEALKKAGFSEQDEIAAIFIAPPNFSSSDCRNILANLFAWQKNLLKNGHKIKILGAEWKEPGRNAQDLRTNLPECLATLKAHNLYAAIEPDLTSQNLIEICQVISKLGSVGAQTSLKVRCGGPNPITHELLAKVIIAVSDFKIPLKATSGLHYAFPKHQNHNNLHGFINIVSALLFRRNLGAQVPENLVLKILTDSSLPHFNFKKDLSYSPLELSVDLIKNTLSQFPIRIGCCDLRDPENELFRIIECSN